jgi:sulfide:quinone oxidoreductase
MAAGRRSIMPFQMARAAIDRREVERIAFVAPATTGWLLPLYEAALITANASAPVTATLITPERRPLELFGPAAAAAVTRALDEAGIEFVGSRYASVAGGTVALMHPGGRSIAVDRVVALPLVRGVRIDGVPAVGVSGLIPVDPSGRVDGLPDVYAIGDATDEEVKQGAIACRQADAVALHIASALSGRAVPPPARLVPHATLLTGGGPPIRLGPAPDPPSPAKLPGRYLAPYLTSRIAAHAALIR